MCEATVSLYLSSSLLSLQKISFNIYIRSDLTLSVRLYDSTLSKHWLLSLECSFVVVRLSFRENCLFSFTKIIKNIPTMMTTYKVNPRHSTFKISLEHSTTKYPSDGENGRNDRYWKLENLIQFQILFSFKNFYLSKNHFHKKIKT